MAKLLEIAERQVTQTSWRPAAQSLKFTLSDLTLAQYRFQALIWDAPVTSLLGLREPLPPASAERGRAAVIRSFPAPDKLNAMAFEGAWLRYVPVHYTRFLVENNGTFEEYLAKFSSKTRKNLRRSVSKFAAAAGEPCWREYRTSAEAREFLRLAAPISAQTYQAKLFNDRLVDDEETRAALESAAAGDCFRGYLLFFQDQPVAFAVCECTGDTFIYKQPGYSPEFKQFSPGTVLLWHIIEKFFAEGSFRYIDFGEGEGFYKELFSNRTVPCSRVYFFPRSAKWLMLVNAHRGWNFLTDTVKSKFLPGVSAKLRKWLRGRSAAEVSEAPAV
jgi:CelD/BcsL family acetyltransferase involved in cellulose biosynthesis